MRAGGWGEVEKARWWRVAGGGGWRGNKSFSSPRERRLNRKRRGRDTRDYEFIYTKHGVLRRLWDITKENLIGSFAAVLRWSAGSCLLSGAEDVGVGGCFFFSIRFEAGERAPRMQNAFGDSRGKRTRGTCIRQIRCFAPPTFSGGTMNLIKTSSFAGRSLRPFFRGLSVWIIDGFLVWRGVVTLRGLLGGEWFFRG